MIKKLYIFIIPALLLACAGQKAFIREIEAYRAEKIKENTSGPRHPLEPGDEKGLRFYPPQKKYRLTAHFEAASDTSVFDMPTYSGITRKYQRFGRLRFRLDGKEYKLTLYRNLMLAGQAQYRNHLFLPFKDATNGDVTYGGGRYIDMDRSALRDGKMTLDFNRAYNPWCAYSDGYNCPIPPGENHLDIAINAGEKEYAGEKRH